MRRKSALFFAVTLLHGAAMAANGIGVTRGEDVTARSVARTICEAGGKNCAAAVSVQP